MRCLPTFSSRCDPTASPMRSVHRARTTQSASRTDRFIGLPKSDHVFDEVVEFFRRNLLFGEAGHGAEAEAHLRFHEKTGRGHVIEAGAETPAAVRMALVTVLHEDNAAIFDVGVGGAQGLSERFAATTR